MFNLLKNIKTTKVMHHFSLINCVVLEKLTNQLANTFFPVPTVYIGDKGWHSRSGI
jgi:hypothetical protein